ncbi:MAG TPA: hypothetical protein VGZ22_29085 [Isosphaeraceae bacterium]|jgi:CDP-diglyceride synthetase|nr:hypothetical protein [Isosphaeraceae bacterium]
MPANVVVPEQGRLRFTLLELMVVTPVLGMIYVLLGRWFALISAPLMFWAVRDALRRPALTREFVMALITCGTIGSSLWLDTRLFFRGAQPNEFGTLNFVGIFLSGILVGLLRKACPDQRTVHLVTASLLTIPCFLFSERGRGLFAFAGWFGLFCLCVMIALTWTVSSGPPILSGNRGRPTEQSLILGAINAVVIVGMCSSFIPPGRH